MRDLSKLAKVNCGYICTLEHGEHDATGLLHGASICYGGVQP